MSTISLTIKSAMSQALAQQKLIMSGKPKAAAQALAQYFKDLASGHQAGIVYAQTGSADPVAASGNFTLDTVIATDAITIGTVTLTFSSTPANENQVEVDGAGNDADASALSAAINAHSVLSQVVTASVASNVVTVTAKARGVIGNQIPISSADATITASGAFLTGGTGGITDAETTYTLGL